VRVLRAWPEPEPGPVDLSPDGASLVYGPEYGRVLVCREVESGQERWRSALSGSTTSLRYSPDGARLAANTLLGHVAMLDAKTGRVLSEHRVSTAPRGRVCWSPDGSRALSTHGHGEAEISLIDRDGGPVRTLALPMKVGPAAFVSDEQIIVPGPQARVLLLDLRTREVVEEFSSPSFEIDIAANRNYFALAWDHGHLLLRGAREGAPLPGARALRAANQPIFEERMARNELRLAKIRSKGEQHTLRWEKTRAEEVWKNGSPAEGWKPWLPLPHGQLRARFLGAESPLLLLCDGRDASLMEVGAEMSERLLLGLHPVPGLRAFLMDVAYRTGLAAVSFSSWNPRHPSQVLLLAVEGGTSSDKA
jgi:hypothetical protein